jgi:biopolymer transport protein ExbB/TolQ
MQKSGIGQMFLPFAIGVLATVALFAILSLLTDHSSYMYHFFFRSWYVQATTSWLFFAAMAFAQFRIYRLKDERRILSEKVSVEDLDRVTPSAAEHILKVIPEKYRTSIGFRRVDELLRAYLHGEEVIRLNQELSRRDAEQIEVGHLVLNALRQLIPVLGFLGTVVGLSLGMVRFPELAKSGQSIDALKDILKGFAASLSVAFDTTLLALAYTVVVVLFTSMLRHSEESFVSDVDHKARMLIMKLARIERPNEPAALSASPVQASVEDFRVRIEQLFSDHLAHWMKTWQTQVLGTIGESLEKLGVQSADQAAKIGGALSSNGVEMLRKLDELKSVLSTPPVYQVTVHPVEAKRHG